MIEPSLENFSKIPRLVVAIVPDRHDGERLSVEQCLPIVVSAAVHTRGWSWPYTEGRLSWGPGDSYVAGETDFGGASYHLEQWRLYRSGQFMIRIMPWEVVDAKYQEGTWSEIQHRHPERNYVKEPSGFLSFLALIYLVTEAYLFAAKLAKIAGFETSVEMRIRLRGIKDWALGPTEPSRPLYDVYMARADTAEYVKSVPLESLTATPVALAVPAITSLFRQFGWMSPPAPATISEHQRGMTH